MYAMVETPLEYEMHACLHNLLVCNLPYVHGRSLSGQHPRDHRVRGVNLSSSAITARDSGLDGLDHDPLHHDAPRTSASLSSSSPPREGGSLDSKTGTCILGSQLRQHGRRALASHGRRECVTRRWSKGSESDGAKFEESTVRGKLVNL
jgi:hypothetical protein